MTARRKVFLWLILAGAVPAELWLLHALAWAAWMTAHPLYDNGTWRLEANLLGGVCLAIPVVCALILIRLSSPSSSAARPSGPPPEPAGSGLPEPPAPSPASTPPPPEPPRPY